MQPPGLVTRLNSEISKAIQTPVMQERMAGEGLEPGGGPPQRFQEVLKRDVPKWQKVVVVSDYSCKRVLP